MITSSVSAEEGAGEPDNDRLGYLDTLSPENLKHLDTWLLKLKYVDTWNYWTLNICIREAIEIQISGYLKLLKPKYLRSWIPEPIVNLKLKYLDTWDYIEAQVSGYLSYSIATIWIPGQKWVGSIQIQIV